jgi:hypothetical protein
MKHFSHAIALTHSPAPGKARHSSTHPLKRSALSTALSVAIILAICPSALAKDKQAKANESQDADRKVAELAVGLQGEIASTFESTVPCELRAPKKEMAEKEFDEIVPKSKIPLFQSREIADMEISSDFQKIMAGQKHGATTAGTIQYRLKNGKQVSLPVEINTRGNSKQGICRNFKPLMLHFKKEDTKGTVFEHIGNHVKLATHCSDEGLHLISEPNSQYVVRESAAYQIVEDMGILGYKTRLINMKYRDNNGKLVAGGISFFLEPDSKMAERWGYEHNKKGNAFENIPNSGTADFTLGTQLVGADDQHPGWNTTALAKDGKPAAMAFYDLDMSLLANPSFYSKCCRLFAPVDPKTDISAIKKFLQDYSGGPEAGRAFLERALSRKEHTMSIVDRLPIQDRKLIKDRLEMWYGAIESVIHGGREPANITIPADMPLGTYKW